ncbi:MAG: hypothetical protein E7255_09290 [Lachnospiraceae bacterium]|jgi:hypothetical protein|nr:hypothetical protein [Lachnospiraceae bacterium]
MKKSKLKIEIIDDGVNMKLLYKLRGKDSNIINHYTGIKQYIDPLQKINHGTICTSILLEMLENNGCIDKTEIISFSVLDKDKKYNIQKLYEAIQWGIDHEVNLISLSIGSKEFITSEKIIEVSKRAQSKNIIIVAAGANDGIITYPACLSSVIGVKTTDLKTESIHKNPIDGIDINANVPNLNLLKILRQDLDYFLHATNSLIAPIITAQIADVFLQEEKIFSILKTKELLAKKKSIKLISDSYDYPPLKAIGKTKEIEDRQIPIIAIEYHHSNKSNIINLAKALQQEFVLNEYNCACISDIIQLNCFEKNRYKLPVKNVKDWMRFYLHFLTSNIIIIIIEEKHISSIISSDSVDAIISEREIFWNYPSYHLKLLDTSLASHNIFKWVINLFNAQGNGF